MNLPNPETLKPILIPVVFSLVCTFFTISVFNTYAQKVDMRFASQDSRMEGLNQTNDSYRQQVYNYLLALSQQVNLTSQDSLQEINILKKSNENLQNQLGANEKKLDNITTYVSNLNLTCTNTTTTVYVNQTVPAPDPDNRSCRQKIIDAHGLGPLFDVVACCMNTPPVGYFQECCACYN